MAYFERVGPSAFRATGHTGGAWDPQEQHIAPALGLLVHVAERDRDARRDDGLVFGRLCFDILGTMPIGVVDASVRVVRAGRTIELVEAALGHDGRTAATLRAWLLRPSDTGDVRGTALPRIPPPTAMSAWDPATVWAGGFVGSTDIRRAQLEPGRAAFWARTPLPLVRDEPVSRLAAAAGLLDIANGITVRASPQELGFPNIDLTAHLFTPPRGDWLGFDTSVSFGPSGVGVTSSVLHDVDGPIGTMSQILTLRMI